MALALSIIGFGTHAALQFSFSTFRLCVSLWWLFVVQAVSGQPWPMDGSAYSYVSGCKFTSFLLHTSHVSHVTGMHVCVIKVRVTM